MCGEGNVLHRLGAAVWVYVVVFATIAMLGCSSAGLQIDPSPDDGTDGGASSDVTTYTIGGSVSGLSGSLTLQNNTGDDLRLTADGEFTFATALTGGATYTVTVLTQPSGQTCNVSNGSGTVTTSNITTVSISCASNFATIGGSIGGLSGTIVLQNNGGDDLTVTQNGAFTFATSLTKGDTYAVTIKTQPSGQNCTVSSGSGTAVDNVSNVTVSCGDTFGLSLTVGGAGNGSVTSDVGSIDCTKASGTCSDVYDDGTEVVLTATADAGYVFSGWSGEGCSGIETCVLTLSAAKSVRATFMMIVFDSALNADGDGTHAANATANIWTIKTDGTSLTALTNTTASGATSWLPRWSHDGEKIVFASSRNPDGTDTVNTTTNTGTNTSNVWVVNADGTNLTALTTINAASTIRTSNPVWSPDDTKIAFYSQRNLDGSNSASATGVNNIWAINDDGTGLTALTSTTASGADSFNPQWSPDGSKVTFYSKRKVDGSDTVNTNNTFNIWLVDADGTNLTALTTVTAASATSSSPRWSPDGSKIVYTSRRNLDGSDTGTVNGAFNIWLINADGTGSSSLTTVTTSGANGLGPQWSPDGSKVAFYAKRNLDGTNNGAANAADNIWIINADGTGLTALTTTTTSGADSINPQWSPDGSKIVFSSKRKTDGTDTLNTNSVSNIWMVNVDGTGLTALTTATASSANSELPVLAP